MVRFKIFFGTINEPADIDLNKWLSEQKDTEILDFKYQQARYGDHSICIKYKTSRKDNWNEL